ncbi:hypothetical protein GOODEAATRI_011232 [Goodea atripinnis]|uniref:Serine/threonine-protein kinase D1-3-like ubiquitin-like domain-containing protein n=1 Tax=Goodea atripinnis TaxID=208336 RepID=A0ABV0N9Q4_9TELE
MEEDPTVIESGAEEVARFVSSLKTELLIDPTGTIRLISCNLGNDQNFTLKLLQALRSLNVETTLHLHNTLLSVNSDGEIMSRRDGVWRSHDYSSDVIAKLSPTGDLLTRKAFGCSGIVHPKYKGNILYLHSLEWPRHPQMFVPMELRKKYPSIDCLEGLTWSLFFEENEKRRAPNYIPNNDNLKAVWLEVTEESSIRLKHISNIQDLLVEIRYCAREEVASDLYYVLNDCIYKIHGKNLSVSLVGKFMRTENGAETELFRQSFGDQQGESSLQELQQGLKPSKFNDFCRQTFQFQQCTYNCERWGRYFMAAVFSASVRNFRTFSLFLMSVIGCEVGRSQGTDSSLCTAFVGDDHPLVTDQPWPEDLKRGFYGCSVDNYEMAPQNRQIWLDQVVAKENSLYIKSKQMMDAFNHNDQTELEIFGKIKVMNKYVFSSYLEYFPCGLLGLQFSLQMLNVLQLGLRVLTQGCTNAAFTGGECLCYFLSHRQASPAEETRPTSSSHCNQRHYDGRTDQLPRRDVKHWNMNETGSEERSSMSAETPSSSTSPALVQFQLGLSREMVRVPPGNLSYRHARRLAAEVIERKAPDCSVVGSGEKILLFRHRLASDELLQRLTDQDELQDGDLIEIIVAGQTSNHSD